MKIKLLILILSCSAMHSFAQVYIKGRIKDKQQDLESATVILLSSDSALIKSVQTNNKGEFIFKNVAPGHYMVSSSLIGYAKFFSQPVSVKEKNIVLPDFVLEQVTTELSGIVVKAKKPLFEQKIDRLVVNVQGNITSTGNTILDILQKTPGIVVNKQNNTIAMNGKTGVRIMVNGKLTELPMDAVIQMLDGMNSSNVEKIELITSPPSKYDAEGSAGIIHIIMKGNANFGTNGSFGLMLGYKWAETLGGNFNVNHRNKKVACFFDYSILRNHNLHIMKMNRLSLYSGFAQTVDDYSHRENITTQQNLNAGLEWKLTNNTLLNLSFTGYRSNWDLNALTDDNNHISLDSTIIAKMNIHESNIWQSATGGIEFRTKINSKTDLSFDLDYLYYHNSNPSDYDNTLLFEQRNVSEALKIDLKKTTPIRFFIASADYQYFSTSSFSLEGGLKGVTSNLSNNVLVQRLENNIWTIDPVFTSYSILNEQSAAAYISAKWQPLKHWQVNGGLRYEYAHTSVGTPMQKDIVDRKNKYLFPTISIKKSFSKSKDLQFSYSKRITRPTYNDIAPFVFFWGPNTFSAGNTALLPAISDAVKAAYQVNRWIISFQINHSKNEINSIPEIDSQSNLIDRSQNLKYLNSLALTNSWSFNAAPWWEVQTNLTEQYQVAQTLTLQNNLSLHMYAMNLNVTNLLKLPKDFTIEVSGMYQSKSLAGISEYLPAGSLNAGIQKKLGKGIWRFAMDDILYTNKWRIKANVPQDNLNAYFKYDFHNQFIRLSYTRNFGNNKLQSVKLKSASEEERARITN